MNHAMNLQQIIYDFLVSQIEFGAYQCRDSLPTVEQLAWWCSVSLETVRTAYLRLKQEGYITFTQKAGAAVAVQYDARQTEQHIQTFFSRRRDAATELCHSMGFLFSRAQWLALKNATPERLSELERICLRKDVLPVYTMLRHIKLIFSTLNNDLLLRLVWQSFIFFQGPFLSLPEHQAAFEDGDFALSYMIDLCRQKDWDGLWRAIIEVQTQLNSAINNFYQNRITVESTGKPVSFHWNVYKKSSQRCYSLALELLKDIQHGVYLEHSFLPAPARIAAAKQVSTITIRRTLALLSQLGVTRTINGVGTQVLQTKNHAENCDFSQPVLQKRLLDFAQSLQILTLTCKGVTELTFAAIDVKPIQHWKGRLLQLKQMQQYHMTGFALLELLSEFAPIQVIREVYTQLLQLLLWGYPLHSMQDTQKAMNAYYLSFIDNLVDCLDRVDGAKLAGELEAALCYELEFAAATLKTLGICFHSGHMVGSKKPPLI